MLAAPVLTASAPAVAATANPPALWYKTDGSPTDAEITYAASHYSVVVLNAWETRALHAIKAANPTITVLAYKCLSSTRSYSGAVDNGQDAAILPTGVGYMEAQNTHPEWFALSTSGQRVQWSPYPGHWQMAVWNTAYQQRWAQNVTSEIVANGWDGVMADNALTTLKWYSSATLAGAPTNAALQAGERGLIATAAASLHAAGKLLVPNIGESRLYPGLWSDWTGLADGGMEESFMHMDEDPTSGYLWDWGSDGWIAQANEAAKGLFLAVTRWTAGDTKAARYGLASFLIAGGGKGAWQAGTDYDNPPWQPEQSWVMGSPLAATVKSGSTYTRLFSNGFVAVNASNSASSVVAVPAGMVDASGSSPTSVTLPPLTGAIFRGTGTTTTTTTTTKTTKWRHHAPAGSTLTTTAAAPVATVATPVAPKAAAVRRATAARLADRLGDRVAATKAVTAPARVATAASRPAAVPAPRRAPASSATAVPVAPPTGPAPAVPGLLDAAAMAGATVLLRRRLVRG